MYKLSIAIIALFMNTAAYADTAPELWTWVKDIELSQQTCEEKSSLALQDIGFPGSMDKENRLVFGSTEENSVVIRCLIMSDTESKILISVAGKDRASVVGIRNQLARSLR